jgi:hypothetical protein
MQRIPHCDLEEVPLERVCVNADAYHWDTAKDLFYQCGDPDMTWSQLTDRRKGVWNDYAIEDRARAHNERYVLVRHIARSESHVAWTTRSGLVIGADFDINAFYVYDERDQAIWIYCNSPEGAIDIIANDDELLSRRCVLHEMAMAELLVASGI